MVYSAIDVPQMMMQKDETFSTLVGGNTNLILYRHNNGESAQKWTKFFGQAWVTLVERSGGQTKANWKLFESSTNEGFSEKTQRVDRFPQEVLQSIPFGEGKGYFVNSTDLITPLISRVRVPLLDEGVRGYLR